MSSGGHGGTEFAEHLQDVCRIRKVKGLYGKAVGNDEVKNGEKASGISMEQCSPKVTAVGIS